MIDWQQDLDSVSTGGPAMHVHFHINTKQMPFITQRQKRQTENQFRNSRCRLWGLLNYQESREVP
ncbi:hypothetical protein ACTXT7_015657 [Hymenolepis weldensis]